MSWYDYPPYTKYQVGTDGHNNAIYKGIFYDVLRKMFDEVCGPCTKVSFIQFLMKSAGFRKKAFWKIFQK